MRGGVSIIVPIHNGEKYLPQCLNSLVNQDYKDIKIFLVNDASTDNSVKVIKEFQDKDARIKLIDNKENHGPAHARNCALEQIDTEFFTFVDCDDWVEPDYISTLVKAFDENTVLTACSFKDEKRNNKFFKNKKEIIKEISLKESFSEVFIDKSIFVYVWNKMFKTSLLKDGVRFNENLSFGEDTIFLVDYLLNCDKNCGNVKYTTKKLYHHIMTKGSLSSLKITYEKFMKQKCFFDEMQTRIDLPKLKDDKKFVTYVSSWNFLLALQFIYFARCLKLKEEKIHFKKLAQDNLKYYKERGFKYQAFHRNRGVLLYNLLKNL